MQSAVPRSQPLVAVDAFLASTRTGLTILRDLIVIVFLLVLAIFPAQIGKTIEATNLTVIAFGIEIKRNLVNSDQELKGARSTVIELKKRLELMKKELMKDEKSITPEMHSILNSNDILLKGSENLVSSINTAVEKSAPAVAQSNRALDSVDEDKKLGYGLVTGEDVTLQAAQDELKKVLKLKIGGDSAIYNRNNSWRTVTVYRTQEEATSALQEIKKDSPPKYAIRSDSYVIRMASWCDRIDRRGDHVQCN